MDSSLDMLDAKSPLRPLVTGWIGKLDLALEFRKPFQEDADECMQFFGGPHDFMWKSDFKRKLWHKNLENAAPAFRMTFNKVFEMVALFVPVLYSQNPIRTVTPRPTFMPPQDLIVDPALAAQVAQLDQAAQANPMLTMDPIFMGQYQQLQMAYQQQMQQYQAMQMQQQTEQAQQQARSELLSMCLNYTPNELNLVGHSQAVVEEAMIKGRGVWVCEEYTPPGSTERLIGTFFHSQDNHVWDPDAETHEDAQWAALRCVAPHWELEREYGWPTGSLKSKAHLESAESQGASRADEDADYHRKQGKTNDTIVYWKIWSKMGMGGRMTGAPEELLEFSDAFGDYCYLVIANGVPYPLNLPPHLFSEEGGADEELLARVEWPVPFWRDGSWPFTLLEFHKKPNSLYPIPPAAPAMGEIKFVNWSMSFLANRIRTTCRDFIAVAKSAASEIKETILHGGDLTIVEIESAMQGMDNVVQFLKQPMVNGDMWPILSAVMEQIDKRLGLTELMYGMSSRQVRSATEANVKREQISIRPDDMANKVEKAMTEVARKEALALRWLIGPEEVLPILGPLGAQAWQTLIMDADVNKVARELDVRIEAGSARKPNKDRDAANWAAAMPVLAPILQGYAQATGNTQPINSAIEGWLRSIDQESSGLLMPPIPPPMPAPPPEQEGEEPKQEQAA
jgi:hypothetical protein